LDADAQEELKKAAAAAASDPVQPEATSTVPTKPDENPLDGKPSDGKNPPAPPETEAEPSGAKKDDQTEPSSVTEEQPGTAATDSEEAAPKNP
jgi:hypothetical protein